MRPFPTSAPYSPFFVRTSVANKQNSTTEVRGLVGQCFRVRPELARCFVNVWLQSRSLPARGRVGLEVHRCVCIIDAGNVFIS
jgi:hypothetical protein